MQPPSGCSSCILECRNLCALRIPELVPKPREIPLKRTDVEAKERNQVGLDLKNSNDKLPSDSRKGGCLDEGLHSSDDFDPTLESRVSSEGNQVIVNAHKGKNLLWDKLCGIQIHNPA